MDNDDHDAPVAISFKDMKKKRNRIPNSLLKYHIEGLKIIKETSRKKSDPRFDPKVNGYCKTDDWTHLESSNDKIIKKLKKYLSDLEESEDKVKLNKALKYLKQRKATMKDVKLTKSVKDKIQSEQVKELESGKIPKFLNKKEVKQRILDERLKTMSAKQREKYLSKKSKAKGILSTYNDMK